jgi:PglD N-terminal domain/Oligosaccharide biosynthesis protein Alg14 like
MSQSNPLIDVVILGVGGHGREMLDILEAVNRQAPVYRFLGFADDGQVSHELLARRGATHLGNHTCLFERNAPEAR